MSTLSGALEARSDQKDETYLWLPYEKKAEIIETISTAAPDALDWIAEALPILKKLVVDCPDCNNQGWYAIGTDCYQELEQCQFCYTIPNSRFNLGKLIAQAEGTPEEATK